MTETTDKKAGRVLLPSYVQPETYDLKVVPDMKAYTFDGIVSITMKTGDAFSEEESKKITLHSKELMYRSAEFKTEDGGTVVKADEVSHKMKSMESFYFNKSVLICSKALDPVGSSLSYNIF